MTAKGLLEKFSNNWQVKIICFVAATLLCVGRTFSRLDKKTFIVPLDVVSTGMVLPVSKSPEFVRITIRSTQENVAEVLPSDLSAALDLTYFYTDGEYLAPVTVKLSPKVLMMDSFEVKMKPERVPIKVEQKVVKYVPVNLSLVGSVAHGYKIAETILNPDYVQITGPKTAVDAVGSINTDIVDVTDLTDSEDYTVLMQDVNSLLQVNSPARVCSVHVSIAPEVMTRTFLGVKVNVLKLDPALEIASDILPITFDAEGEVAALEDFTLGENVVTVSCSGIKTAGVYNLPVRIALPYPLKVQSMSTETVRVSVRFKAVPKPQENTGADETKDAPAAEGAA